MTKQRCCPIVWFGVYAFAVAIGCREPPPKTPARTVPEAARLDAVRDAGEVRASRNDRIEILTRFAPVLPLRLRAIGVVPAEALRQAVRDVAAANAYALALEDPAKGIVTRIRALYGLDWDSPGPWCVFAWMDVDGSVLVCEGMTTALERPAGSVGWNAWNLQGHRVPGTDMVAAAGEGYVAIGAESAVQRVAMTLAGAWPPLRLGMARIEAAIRRAGLGGEDVEAALWFLDPDSAPWCLPGICVATAVFASRSGMQVTAEAKPGLSLPVKASLDLLWESEVRRPFQARTLPDAVSKPADLLVREAIVEMRGPLVTLTSSRGDPVFLATALYPDHVMRFLGPRE